MNKVGVYVTILSVLAIAGGVSAWTACPAVQCTTENLNVGNKTGAETLCALLTGTTGQEVIQVSTCNDDGLYCYGASQLLDRPTDLGAYGNCQYKPIPINIVSPIPGNTCELTQLCGGTATCNSQGLCQGAAAGETCSVNTDCNIGLFCLATFVNQQEIRTCQPVAGPGQGCGTNTTLCGYGLTCVNNVCQKFMSLPVGTKLSSSSANAFAACSSLTTLVDPTNGLVCANAPKLIQNELINATNTACEYQIPGQTQPMTAIFRSQCGFSQHGYAVCPLGIGDLTSQFGYIYNTYYSNDLSQICHVSQSVTKPCDNAYRRFGITPQLQAFFNVYGFNLVQEGLPYVQSTYLLADNADCVKKEVTYQYWGAFGSASTLTLGAGLVMGLVALLF